MFSNQQSAVRFGGAGVFGAAAFVLLAAVSSNAAVDTVRVNCGGPDYTDSKGQKWAADSGFTGGEAYSNYDVTIAGTPDPALHQDERWDDADFSYAFNLIPGTYRVNLHNATLWDGACGEGTRVFDVTINGTKVLTNYDMGANGAPCLTAQIKTFRVEAPTGKIDIVFNVGAVQNPKINAIEITPFSSTSIKGASVIDLNRFAVTSSNGELQVRSQAEGAYSLSLTDLQGKLIERKSGAGTGSQSFTNLRPGLYLLTYESGGESVTRKVDVVR